MCILTHKYAIYFWFITTINLISIQGIVHNYSFLEENHCIIFYRFY